jgi:hypothetical protein
MEVLFREMKERYLIGDDSLRPDRLSYVRLINANARTMRIGAAEGMLWEMVDDFLKGNDAAEPQLRKWRIWL